MIISLFRRNRQPATIPALYGMIVAQARLPAFYRDFAIPDTVNGRFDLIVLHLALVIRRLSQGGAKSAETAQQLFDHFCCDMDGNLREMGVADLKVPQEMRRIGEAFYGRAAVYDAALARSDDNTLAQALRSNILGDTAGAGAASGRLAAYVRAVDRALAVQRTERLAAGLADFADPAAFGGVRAT